MQKHRQLELNISYLMQASGSCDKTVRLWDPRHGRCLFVLEGQHGGWIQAVAFSPDSLCVASAGDQDVLCVWDVLTGQCIQALDVSVIYVQVYGI